ncbi:MAG: hypothetical protein FIA99_16310 [Ruminiclostridium sp.]|nr:hypothetical protein [Ruminiclostridium sp.]
MKNLLYKEFYLAINPLFYLLLLFGALLLIPKWLFFLAPMYFFFIFVPNIFLLGKSQKDIEFSVMLPVRKRDVVKARIVLVVLLELLQIFVAAVFGVIHMEIYSTKNFLMDPNFAFFGFVFMMYAIFNVVFFPMFYKTAYKIGVPTIIANAAAILFAAGVEFAVLAIPAFKVLDAMRNVPAQLWVLAGGIGLFALLNIAAYRISSRRFEHISL